MPRVRAISALVIALFVLVGGLPLPAASAARLPTTASPFILPVAPGDTTTVTQGNNMPATPPGYWDHLPGTKGAFAFDFIVGTQNFPVVAAQGGTVLGMRGDSDIQCSTANYEDSPENKPLTNCWAQANYVLIADNDGKTAALYMHLNPNSIVVHQGQQVTQGTQLALAGTTGWSTGVHLHFQVETIPTSQQSAGWWWTQSQPITFANPEVLAQDADGIPLTGQSFHVAAPISTPTSTAPTATPTTAPPQASVYIGDANDSLLHALNASDGTPEWNFKTGGQSAQALAVANGIVYVGEIDGADTSSVTSRVYAVDTATHTSLWHIDGVPTTSGELGNGNVLTFDALDNGLVYLSLGNNITAFDAQSGHQRWQYNPGSDTISAFALSSATLYVAHDNHGANPMLDAVNAISGSTLWSKATANPVVSNGVAADANTVYVAESDGGPGSYTGNVDVGDVGVEAFRGDSGQHRWRYDGGTEFGIALWVSGERVYVTDIGMEGGGFLALDAGTGKITWTPQLNGCNSQDPYPTQNAAYDICTNYDTQQESVAALDPATGHVNWYQTSFGNDAVSDLFVSDGNLYAWGDVTYALDPGTGSIRWHKPGTFVAAGQGIFLVVDAAGNCTVYTASNGMQIWHFAAGTLSVQGYTPPVLIG